MLMFPSELPAVLQAEESAPEKEEKITEDDFLALLTDLDREFVKKPDDVMPKKKRVLEKLELPPKKTMLLTTKPTETKTKKRKWLEVPETPRKQLTNKAKEVTPETPKEVTPETPKESDQPKKATQTEKEEEGIVINMSVYFTQQMKQGSSAHKALMEMLQ